MKPEAIRYYRSPVDQSSLELENAAMTDGEVVSGDLVGRDSRRFPITDGVPNLTYPAELSQVESQTRDEYDRVSHEIYDAAVDWQFAALYEDENLNRELMVDMLAIAPGHRVLEVGCGTGRDSFRLARRLHASGALFLQDLSSKMVLACIEQMARYDQTMHFRCEINYSVSNASYLPFPDDFFDGVFHFGGFNQFGDLKRAAAELTRVAKPGGRVLYGDESVAPWLRGSEFEGIVCTNNPLFRHELPIATVPDCAREVTVRWIIGNCFYVIAFTKGDGPPPLNLDLPHKGWRGGTMRTRYFGVLEGVTVEAKELARKAAAKSGVSVHAWLDRLVRDQAGRDLAGPAEGPRCAGHE